MVESKRRLQVYSLKFTEQINETWPESLKFTVLVLQSSAQQRHAWILQVVIAQVQLSKTRGLGAEHWGQNFKTFLWEVTHFQSEETIIKKKKIRQITFVSKYYRFTFFKWVLTKVQLQQQFLCYEVHALFPHWLNYYQKTVTRTSVYLQELNYFLHSVWSWMKKNCMEILKPF